jgi:hypothetical protein
MDEQARKRSAAETNKLFEDRAEQRFGRRHRDPARIDRMLEEIRLIWIDQPDTRLFQLLINVWVDEDNLYNVEDDYLEPKLVAYRSRSHVAKQPEGDS